MLDKDEMVARALEAAVYDLSRAQNRLRIVLSLVDDDSATAEILGHHIVQVDIARDATEDEYNMVKKYGA